MSLLGEPPHENHQKEAEVQEDEEPDSEKKSNEDVQVKDFLKPSQTEKRAISPLTLLRDDFNQFTEEIRNQFKEKDTNPKSNGLTEKQVRPRTLFKEDLNNFRENLSSVFKIGVPKEQENKDEAEKEDDKSGVKASKAERAGEPFKSLFKREKPLLKIPQKAEDVKEVKKSNTGLDFRGSLRKQNREKGDTTKDCVNKSKNGCEKKTGIPQTQQSKMFASKTADQKCETEDRSEDSFAVLGDEDEALANLSSEILNSGINLLTLRNNLRDQPIEDQRSPKSFATYLTLDPNTASAELCLTDGNRKATRGWLNSCASEHPDRFEGCPQVLCREGLLDLVYWEVVWSGGTDIGVAYYSISRNREAMSCLLGHNKRSWSLECSEGSYTPCHNNKRFKSSSPEPFTHRVGVFLDWNAGSLSFYCISKDAMVHLHTFKSTFTEPLYPAFWVWSFDGSVSLRQVELDWERLLQ
ncbi:E3 ubiquitin/ISG15 ligase TRIM25 [Kryptolebias marmoratus]|uniref:E3 ubiquitin/ISG15 ligase TRIM25-like n=1 Tax=Kryptolebias marmoratus TaxID=37003 RepID=A0A3Q3GLN9_KRYMA|nr:E3 ubiquitin/ISG15 ligase TRIM25 [Kryptolebias marmoratus]